MTVVAGLAGNAQLVGVELVDGTWSGSLVRGSSPPLASNITFSNYIDLAEGVAMDVGVELAEEGGHGRQCGGHRWRVEPILLLPSHLPMFSSHTLDVRTVLSVRMFDTKRF